MKGVSEFVWFVGLIVILFSVIAVCATIQNISNDCDNCEVCDVPYHPEDCVCEITTHNIGTTSHGQYYGSFEMDCYCELDKYVK